jgi:hypothetical protein
MRAGDLAALEGVIETTVRGNPAADIRSIYTSDLLSDVLAHAAPDSALVTIQAHRNTVAVAAITGIRAIVFAHARAVPADAVSAAEAEGIALYRADADQFTLSCRLRDALDRSRGS